MYYNFKIVYKNNVMVLNPHKQGWQKPQKSKKYVRGFWVIGFLVGFSEVFGVFLYLKSFF